MNNKKGSAGGKAMAIIQREMAIKNYYLNPNYCKECGKIIEIGDNDKVCIIKRRKFCNKSCSVKYNNRIKEENKKEKIDKKEKEQKITLYDTMTKGELFNKCSNWQSARSAIQKNAKRIFEKSDKEKCCEECGYDKHYEICHIKSVSDFSDDTLISEINNIDNLKALCPNHHWEFDNNK